MRPLYAHSPYLLDTTMLEYSPYYLRIVFADTGMYERTGPPVVQVVVYIMQMWKVARNGMHIEVEPAPPTLKKQLITVRKEGGNSKREIVTLEKGILADNLPPKIQERLAVMLVAEPGTVIEGIGWRAMGSIVLDGRED